MIAGSAWKIASGIALRNKQVYHTRLVMEYLCEIGYEEIEVETA